MSNYRSIRDEQSLSLVPLTKDAHLQNTNTFSTGLRSIPLVLKGAVVYGANASGKSNLIHAMETMPHIVRDSSTGFQPGARYNIQNFALDSSQNDSPTSFEVSVLLEGLRYQYGFALTPDRIWDEWLLVYKTVKPQEWFSRKWDPQIGKEEWGSFSSHFPGPKETWRQATRDNALFLSTAVQLNSAELKPLWNWIVRSLKPIPPDPNFEKNEIYDAMAKPNYKKKVLEWLSSADLGIEDYHFKKEKSKRLEYRLDSNAARVLEAKIEEGEVSKPQLEHKGDLGSATLDLKDESDGTQRFFHMAVPILTSLEVGATLVIDELEKSLHPLLVRHILNLFFSPETNPKGAQIIFTTHNTSFLDAGLFRRDQIWFTEKGTDLATRLRPLTEFSPRKDEAFEKGYREGRYGGLPFLHDFFPGKAE